MPAGGMEWISAVPTTGGPRRGKDSDLGRTESQPDVTVHGYYAASVGSVVYYSNECNNRGTLKPCIHSMVSPPPFPERGVPHQTSCQ